MLSLTKKTEYALIATCHLARVGSQRVVSAREIADRYTVRLPLLMNVLKVLNQRGFLRSVRGARGGYSLAVAARDISVAGLIEAVEGPVRLVRCAPPLALDEHDCELRGSCPVRMPLYKIHDQLRTFLSGLTVADVAFDPAYATQEEADHGLKVLAQ